MNFQCLLIHNGDHSTSSLFKLIRNTRLFSKTMFAENLEKTAGVLQSSQIDIIFADMEELGMDMITEFMTLLNCHDDWCDIPVVLGTTDAAQHNRIIALEKGVSDCLSYSAPTAETTARCQIFLKHKKRAERLRTEKAHLAQLALTDRLTGAFNRAYFDAVLESEMARSRRSENPFSLLMLDIDHFKAVNDTFGHLAGDRALQLMASTVKRLIRSSDIFCRFGGEEFTLILPDTPADKAMILAERIRQKVAGLTIDFNSRLLHFTVSIGIASPTLKENHTAAALINQADNALYRAKSSGRNRCIIADNAIDSLSHEASSYPASSWMRKETAHYNMILESVRSPFLGLRHREFAHYYKSIKMI